jgi:hypothetical protein
MWQAGAAPFAEVLEQLRPHRLLIFGKQLAAYMTEPRARFTLGTIEGEEVRARSHVLDDGTKSGGPHDSAPPRRVNFSMPVGTRG